jgi:hypothetical protein
MDYMSEVDALKAIAADVEVQVGQAVAGKKVAIGRARKALQEIKKKAQEIRLALMELKEK